MLATNKPRVLLLVDSADDLAVYEQALAGSFQTETMLVHPGIAVLIQRMHPDVVLMDYSRGDPAPHDLAYALRMHPNPKTYTGIVWVSRSCGEVPVSKGIQSESSFGSSLEPPTGIDVICTREQAASQIRPLIKTALRMRATMQELSAANRQLGHVSERVKRLSLTDDTTGLYNMRFMSRQIGEEFKRAERYEKHLSLLAVDIDHFRDFSVKLDPATLHATITQIGQEIGDGVRFEVDYAARAGIDEFLLLLPETDLKGAQIVAERLRNKIASTSLPHARGLTASIGLASFDGTRRNMNVVSELLRTAEDSLQRAKELGRNQVCMQYLRKQSSQAIEPGED